MTRDSIAIAIPEIDSQLLSRFPSIEWKKAVAVVRFDAQIPAFDSSPLAELPLYKGVNNVITAKAICEALDNPGRVCSEGKMNHIAFSLEVKASYLENGKLETYSKLYQGLEFVTVENQILYQGESAWADSGFLNPIRQRFSLGLDSVFESKSNGDGKWIIYIPGSSNYSVWCKDTSSLNLWIDLPAKVDLKALYLAPNRSGGSHSIFDIYPRWETSGTGAGRWVLHLGKTRYSVNISESTFQTIESNQCGQSF